PGLHAGRAKNVLILQDAGRMMKEKDILVTRMTNPDWVPYMKIAGAIVTEDGGRRVTRRLFLGRWGSHVLSGRGMPRGSWGAGRSILLMRRLVLCTKVSLKRFSNRPQVRWSRFPLLFR